MKSLSVRWYNQRQLRDFCHPSEQACQVGAEAIEPVVEKHFGKLE